MRMGKAKGQFRILLEYLVDFASIDGISSSGESVASSIWAKAALPMRLPPRLLGAYLLEDTSALPLRIGPRRYGRTTDEVSEESSRRSRGHVAERVWGFRWSSSSQVKPTLSTSAPDRRRPARTGYPETAQSRRERSSISRDVRAE